MTLTTAPPTRSATSEGKPAVGSSSSTQVADLALVLLPVLLAFAAVRRLSDPDLWWHLRTGELLLQEGLVTRDPWSFATTHPWLLHEWLSEVVMALAYSGGGMAGVVVLQAVVIGLLGAALVVTCRSVARPGIAAGTAIVAFLATMPGFGTRPQLVSWVLLALVCPYLHRCVAERRLPLLLVPVIWLWANLHGLWFVGLALFGALVLGLAFELGLRQWRVLARYSGVGLAALFAAATTPSGPALLLGPFRVREYAHFVDEWDPPSLLEPATAAAVLLLAVVVIGWARSGSRVPASTICFVGAVTAIGLMYERTVPVLAIAVAPLAAATMHNWTGRPLRKLRTDRRLAVTIVLAGALTIPELRSSAVNAAVPHPAALLPVTSEAVLAVGPELDALPGRARVLNEYELGGWLIWAARDTSPAVDGRAELYSVDYLERYFAALELEPGWRDFVREVDVDAALLYDETPLVEGLRSLGWQVVFEEAGLLVLVPEE